MTNVRWTRRDFVRISAAAGAALLGGPVLLSACESTNAPSGGPGGGALDRVKKAGTVRVGIAGEIPYGYTDDTGKVTGEAPEVARAAFRNLGVNNVNAKQVSFDQLIPGLNTGDYDLVAAGMAVKPARCANAAFSVPDYQALPAFLVPKGNPQQVHNFDDIKAKDLVLAVESGTVEKDYATAAGIPAGKIQTFDSQNALLQAVTGNRAYAAVLTDISFRTLVKQNPDAGVEVTPGFAPMINGQRAVETGAFVFRKADNDLREAFNAELKKLHDNGQWVQITAPFGFARDNLPAPEATTEKLCAAS